MKTLLITAVLALSSHVWATSSCSLNNVDIIPEHLQMEFDSVYPGKLVEAQDLFKNAPNGRVRIDDMVFTNAADYAKYASKLDATFKVSGARLGELEDVITDTWKAAGYSDSQIGDMLGTLQTKVKNGQAIWADGNFRYVTSKGDVLGANLTPDDLGVALGKAQEQIAKRAASVGDSGAAQVVEDITSLRSTRDQIAAQAQSQGWTVAEVRGHTVVEIKTIDPNTAFGRKLTSITGYYPGREVILSFSDDGTSVAVHLVGALNSDGVRPLVGAIKNYNGKEFKDLLF